MRKHTGVISFCSQWKWEWHPETILVLQPTMMKTRVAVCNLSNFPFSQERQTWYFITWRLCWQLVCQLVTLPWLLHTTCRYVYWTVTWSKIWQHIATNTAVVFNLPIRYSVSQNCTCAPCITPMCCLLGGAHSPATWFTSIGLEIGGSLSWWLPG